MTRGDQPALAGDDLLPEARAQATHEIDIAAPPAEVWPWLVQMGRLRGGWYSWDLLDNGGTPSADRIIPELQQLAVGDVLPFTKTGDGPVALVVEAPRSLVIGSPELLPGQRPAAASAPLATWAFSLQPAGNAGTHLAVRVRAVYRPSVLATVVSHGVRILHDFMERKQLRTLKQRAEAKRVRRPLW